MFGVCVTTVYQICGLHFVKTKFKLFNKLSWNFLSIFILLMHLLYLSINLHFQYDYHYIYFQYPDYLGTVTNFLEMMFPIFAHFVIILESFSKTKKTNKIINKVHEIKLKLGLEVKFPFIKFLFLFLANSFIYLTLYMLVENYFWKFHLTFVMISVFLGNLFEFYYTFHVNFIDKSARFIQCKLEEMSKNRKKDLQTLKLLKSAAGDLWILSDMINERFAYSILTSATLKMFHFVIDLYWIYIRIMLSNYDYYFTRNIKFMKV